MNTNPNTQIIPPFRFAIIEEGLYRGSYPTEKNFRFLKRLKLKTIVSLTPKPPSKPFLNFCEQYGTTSKHFAVSKFKDDVTISASQVVQLLEMMIDPANLPLYCHCLDGANVTGTIFMCLRKLENWNLSAIISEFTRFTRGSCITSSESEFVETFKAEIDVPLTIPSWLWQGVRMSKHPTLKLRLVSGTTHPSLTAAGVVVPGSAPLSSSTATFSNIPVNNLNSLAGNSNLGQSPISSFSSIASPIINSTSTAAAANTTTSIPSSSILLSTLTTISNTQAQQQQQQQQQQQPTQTQQQQQPIQSSQQPTQTQQQSIGDVKSINNTNTNISTTATSTTTTTTQSTTIKFDIQSPRATISSPPNTPASSASTSISNLLTNPKDKDKKKKIEEIKLQFDAGKFNLPVESKSLDALALERSPPLSHTQSNVNSTITTSNISSTNSSGNNSSLATPTSNRTLLQTSSEFSFTNVNLLNTLNNSSTPPK